VLCFGNRKFDAKARPTDRPRRISPRRNLLIFLRGQNIPSAENFSAEKTNGPVHSTQTHNCHKSSIQMWLFGPPNADQAQAVVTALQEQLDERQQRIHALEKALKDEKNFHEKILNEEISELEMRKVQLHDELKYVNAVLKEKKLKLKDSFSIKDDNEVEEKQAVSEEDKDHEIHHSDGEEVMVDARYAIKWVINIVTITKYVRSEPKEEKIPLHPELEKVLKVDPNAAVIIQRSQV
jgi:hypothetical protein